MLLIQRFGARIHKRGNLLDLSFYIWVTSLSIVSSFIHVPANFMINFSLQINRIPKCVCMRFSLPFLGVVERTAATMPKQVSVVGRVLNPLGMCRGVVVDLFLTLRILLIDFHKGCTNLHSH